MMSENCVVIAIFPIYGQFGAIWKPYSGRIACKTYVLININLLSYKTKNGTKKSLTQLSYTIALNKSAIFAKYRWFFPKKMLT